MNESIPDVSGQLATIQTGCEQLLAVVTHFNDWPQIRNGQDLIENQARLEARVHLVTAERNELLHQLDGKTIELEDKEQDLVHLNEHIHEKRWTILNHEIEIKRLKQDSRKDLKSKVADLTKVATDLRETQSKLVQIVDQDATIAHLKGQLTLKEELITELNQTVANQTSELKKLRPFKKVNLQLRSDLTAKDVKIKQMKRDYRQLERDLNSESDQIESYKNKLSKKIDQVQAKVSELNKSNEKVTKLRSKCVTKTNEITDLKRTNNGLTTDIKEKEGQIDELLKTVSKDGSVPTELRATTAAMVKLKSRIASLEKECEEQGQSIRKWVDLDNKQKNHNLIDECTTSDVHDLDDNEFDDDQEEDHQETGDDSDVYYDHRDDETTMEQDDESEGNEIDYYD